MRHIYHYHVHHFCGGVVPRIPGIIDNPDEWESDTDNESERKRQRKEVIPRNQEDSFTPTVYLDLNDEEYEEPELKFLFETRVTPTKEKEILQNGAVWNANDRIRLQGTLITKEQKAEIALRSKATRTFIRKTDAQHYINYLRQVAMLELGGLDPKLNKSIKWEIDGPNLYLVFKEMVHNCLIRKNCCNNWAGVYYLRDVAFYPRPSKDTDQTRAHLEQKEAWLKLNETPKPTVTDLTKIAKRKDFHITKQNLKYRKKRKKPTRAPVEQMIHEIFDDSDDD
jgi:hypothetical protein